MLHLGDPGAQTALTVSVAHSVADILATVNMAALRNKVGGKNGTHTACQYFVKATTEFLIHCTSFKAL